MPRTRLPRLVNRGLALVILLTLLFAPSAEGGDLQSVEVKADGSILENNEEYLLDQQLAEAYQAAKETLEEFNKAKEKLVSTSNKIIEDSNSTSGITQKINDLEETKDTILKTRERIDAGIRDINAQQISALKKKLEILLERELKRRAMVKEKKEVEARRKLVARSKGSSSGGLIPDGAITKDELDNLIDVKKYIKNSDKELEVWFLKMVEEEVEALQGELEEAVIDATTTLGEMEEAEVEDTSNASGEKCSGANMGDAVQTIQESLVKYSRDKVGMVDHLAGATVVHYLTSNNYVPPSSAYFPLEGSFLYRYLPNDWERGLDAILPKGWRRWNVAIPDFVYHTFVSELHHFCLFGAAIQILTHALYAFSLAQTFLRNQFP